MFFFQILSILANIAQAVPTTGSTVFPNGIPSGIPSTIDDFNLANRIGSVHGLLGQDAVNRLDNSWMASCYAFCAWQVDSGFNSKVCATNIEIHTHGVVIKGSPGSQEFFNSQLTMNYVQMYDHMEKRGYYNPLDGYHSCDCGENMPVVKRADASKMKQTPTGRYLKLNTGLVIPDPSDPENFELANESNSLKVAYNAQFNVEKGPPGNLRACL